MLSNINLLGKTWDRENNRIWKVFTLNMRKSTINISHSYFYIQTSGKFKSTHNLKNKYYFSVFTGGREASILCKYCELIIFFWLFGSKGIQMFTNFAQTLLTSNVWQSQDITKKES